MSRRSEARRTEGIDEYGFPLPSSKPVPLKTAPDKQIQTKLVLETYDRLKSLRKTAKQLGLGYQKIRAIVNEHYEGFKGSATQ